MKRGFGAFALLSTVVSSAATSPTMAVSTPDGPIAMPTVGLGSAFGFTPPGSTDVAYNATLLWLQNGGRSVHTAWMYCNQPAIGRAVADFLASSSNNNSSGGGGSGSVTRADLWIESMLPPWQMGYNETKKSFADTLAQLGVEYLDLYMFHWPGVFVSNLPMEPSKHVETCGVPVTQVPACKVGQRSWAKCRLDSWRAMLELQAAGKIRALGTSNFEVPQLRQLLAASEALGRGGALAVNQVENHIGYHDDYLQAWCASHGIAQQAYSPLGSGAIATSKDPVVLAAAAKHNVSTAQVGLRFLAQSGLSVVPKAGTTAYQLENLGIFSFALEDAEMAALGALAQPYGRGVQDGMSQMCIEEATGYMARCIYLDEEDSSSASGLWEAEN